MSAFDAINEQQRRFVEEYLLCLNYAQALAAAGYSKNTTSRDILTPNVRAAIAERQEARRRRLNYDADRVLERLIEIDALDVADILNDDGRPKPVREWPLEWRRSIGAIDIVDTPEGVVKKLKLPDKLKNIELIGKHIGVQAWKEQSNVTIQASGIDELHAKRLGGDSNDGGDCDDEP